MSANTMIWQTLLPYATSISAAVGRSRRGGPDSHPGGGGVQTLERMGRSVELLARLISADATPAVTPMVAISSRETAVEILRNLLVDPRERVAYSEFVRLFCRPARTELQLDAAVAGHVAHQRWSQLSSVTFARLLLSPEVVDELSRRISAERPVEWEGLLPPRSSARGGKKSAPSGRAR